MNNNRVAMSDSINKSLGFVESIGENPREEFSRKRTVKIPLRYDENTSTQLKLNIETFFINSSKKF